MTGAIIKGSIMTKGSIQGQIYNNGNIDGHVVVGGSSVVVDPTLTIEGAAADAKATGDALKSVFTKLSSNKVLGFYCIEDVTIVTNGVSKTYPANSLVEVSFVDGDVFEIIPTSDNSIMALSSFPGALGTFYPWLEGVKQFSNILFDMNDVDMYSKWSQGNQGAYQVQFAQYTNCIFWSDNPYVSDVNKRTNYTLFYSSQLPLCYSNIPDNTFKAFYLAFNVNSDPNWGNKTYRDSFAKANWATQVFSYYGARTIGVFGHDDPDFNITLPKDCRGLMCEATAIENAGTFDAINTTNFGAKQGSWRDAFRMCYSLRNLYIKNLKANLNVSWSPLNYESISFIISKAANTSKITISVSPYTYNVLSQSDFDLAKSKNITIELLTTNYVEDKRLSDIANKVDKTYMEQYIEKYLTDNFQPTVDTSNLLTKTEQTLTEEELEQVRVNLKNAGRHTAGTSMTPYEVSIDENSDIVKTNGDPIVASEGAEIFNDYTNNVATGLYSSASGYHTQATGNYSVAEGYGTKASGIYSHAMGYCTQATKAECVAMGMNTVANGGASLAGGYGSVASGINSISFGYGTIANGMNQVAFGKYNVSSISDLLIVGKGRNDGNRQNAFVVSQAGTGWFAGNVSANGIPTEPSHLITKKYLEDNIASLILANLPIYEGEVETV